jgi:hypothetical protein
MRIIATDQIYAVLKKTQLLKNIITKLLRNENSRFN